ncbi:gamma-taxilin-like isoform X2 [Varroa jacobsoni]|uniref:gamma-taxilin-like isoform X2 n=1 Tax=Varroa jacobsoni TaxID=62625 RepID=UPI000BF8163D|nr:gamma-taxilin-like isoform X2 [Varroa jacobsoni]
MSDVISPIPSSGLGGKDDEKNKSTPSQKQNHEQTPEQHQLEAQISESEKPLVTEAIVADVVKVISKAQETAIGVMELSTPWPAAKEQKIGSGEPKSSPDDLKLDVAEKQDGFIEQETLAKNQATSGLTPAEELASVTQKKDALEKQRLSEKEIRGLNKILFECRGSAQGVKGDVLKVLQERRLCEEECLKIEKNIGEKLAALTAEVHRSTKECMTEEVEPEARTPIPVGSGSSLGTAGKREKRANSKSATPPPSGLSGQDKDRALQDRICDLSKQEPAKKLSASSKKKAVESVLRSLGDIDTVESKLRALCELHYETLEQLRETQATAEKWKKQFQASQKENNRSLLARDRLEGLCRELQKHNNAIKEESALRRREEEEKRKHIAAKFQATLTDISTLMADTQETSAKLRQDNAQLAGKLRTLVNHYDIWEKHSENMLKQKTIEADLAMAKLREAQLLREKDVTEVEHSRKLLETATKEMQLQLKASLRNEILLREQLKLHNDKYEEFQEAIVSSNKMFTDFKGEVESMGKQTRKFEKEALQWKQRWEEANLATARVFQEKTKSDFKVETLSRLCRSLQDKLRITNKDMAELESSVASQVVTEEKIKLEEELLRKQREIEQHKHALKVRQKEVQSELAGSTEVAQKVSQDIEQTPEGIAEGPVPEAVTINDDNTDTGILPEESQEAQQANSGSSKKDAKKKNKKRH